MSDMSMRAGPGRTYRFLRSKPTYPFLFGLSYTNFELSWASLPPSGQTTASVGAGLRFGVNVTNAGHRRGSKVVASFISFSNISDGPRKQLFAMERRMLSPGASEIVSSIQSFIHSFLLRHVSSDLLIYYRYLLVQHGTGGRS